MSWRACGLYLMRECFLKHSRRKYWFRIVFYSILELSAPLDKVSFLAILQFLLWILCLGEHVACTRCVNAFFKHSKRKSWFRTVFSVFLSRGHSSKSCFSTFFSCFCKSFIVISSCRVGVIFGTVLVMQQENLDFLLFFTAFWSCGHLFPGDVFSDFWSFLCELCVLISLWAWVHFFITPHENLDSALFFTALLRRGHSLKMFLFF